LSEDLCFDTNIILGYATDFETIHVKCQTIFQDSRIKRTCSRVHSEIGRIKSRRTKKIYKDLLKYIQNNISIDGFTPSAPIKNNDLGHLRALLADLRRQPIGQALGYLRRKIREIESGIRDALDKLARPHIGISNDVACEASLNRSISNMNDCRILSDALCWAEKENYLIFCTNDNHDFIRRRNDIYRKIAQARSYEHQDIPIKIMGLNEMVP